MPSVGSTPTTSPSTTVNSSQNDKQSTNNSSIYTQCNHQSYNQSGTSVTSITISGSTALNDTNSSTTTSSISSPINSSDLLSPLAVSIDRTVVNHYPLNAQITSYTPTNKIVSTIVTSPNNSSPSPSCITQFNYSSVSNKNPFYLSNNKHHQLPHADSTKFMVIKPAVSIDRDFDNDTGAPATEDCNELFDYSSSKPVTTNFTYTSINNNILDMSNIRTNNITVSDSKYYDDLYSRHLHDPINEHENNTNNSTNNFRFKYNSIYNQHQQKSTQNIISKSTNAFSDFTAANAPSSWRWCSLICAAMRCFGGGRNNPGTSQYKTTFSTRNYTQVKDDSTSSSSESRNRLTNNFNCVGGNSSSNYSCTKLNRNLNSSYQYNSSSMIGGPFATPRKTRDHMNNICYEL